MSELPGAKDVIEGLTVRLQDLAARRPFVFHETRRADAEAFLDGMTSFEGCLMSDLARAKRALGFSPPEMLVWFYLRMGRRRGHFFRGSDVASVLQLAGITAEIRAFAREAGTDLPETAVGFMIHQGYAGTYTLGVPSGQLRERDAPVYTILRGEAAPRETAPSLEAFFDAEVKLMEELTVMQRDQGGYYLTVGPAGVREVHPALSERPRPLDVGDRFLD